MALLSTDGSHPQDGSSMLPFPAVSAIKVDAATQAKAESKSEVAQKAQSKTESKQKAEAETKSEAKADSKMTAKIHAKSEASILSQAEQLVKSEQSQKSQYNTGNGVDSAGYQEANQQYEDFSQQINSEIEQGRNNYAYGQAAVDGSSLAQQPPQQPQQYQPPSQPQQQMVVQIDQVQYP